jgi:hypothetical protein
MDSIERVTNWLLHTQDPSGQFGYQGKVSPDATLVSQSETRPGMTAAGLGSLYICSTMLGIARAERRRNDLPSALKEIRPKDNNKAKSKSRIDPRLVHEATARSVQWFKQNTAVDPPGFTHYFLYALERCMSVREFCEQRVEREPQWYNDGAHYLIKSQKEDGSWSSAPQAGAVVDTAFSVLFLLRSMKKSLEKSYAYGDGTMIGGRGIPKDTSRVELLRDGRVVPRALLDPSQKLLAALDNPDKQNFEQSVDLLADLPADTVEMLSAKHREAIRRLVGNKSPVARLAAVQALGKTRDLDNVDVLIYALSDPDATVVHAANEALRRIARNPLMSPIPDDLTDADRRAAIEKWTAWYRAIRPDAEVGP